MWQLCLHSVTQPYNTWPRWREQGEGLRSLPLVRTLSEQLTSPPPLNIIGSLSTCLFYLLVLLLSGPPNSHRSFLILLEIEMFSAAFKAAHPVASAPVDIAPLRLLLWLLLL